MTVYLTRGTRAVAQQTVSGSHSYRFLAPPGSYVIATHEGVGGSRPASVTVRPGKTTHADIPSLCE